MEHAKPSFFDHNVQIGQPKESCQSANLQGLKEKEKQQDVMLHVVYGRGRARVSSGKTRPALIV